MKTHALRALVALTLLAAAPSASARPAARAPAAPGRGSEALSFWAVLDPGPVDGIGLGARVMMPVVPEGLIGHPRVRDELTLELGADFVHYEDRIRFWDGYVYDYSWNGLLPVVGATWNFWFNPRLALYPKLDLGWWFGWYGGPDPGPGYGRTDFDGVFLQGAVGLIYRFQHASLRVELGSGLLRVGFGLPF